MAENKKSFILYADLIHTASKLPKLKQADLFMTILRYVNDENPVPKDILVEVAFEPIKQQLKRDLKYWESKKEKRSEAGKKGMESRWHHVTNDNKDNNTIQPITPITNITVNDTVTVNDNVNVNVIKRERENKFSPPSLGDLENEFSKKLDEFTAQGEARKFLDFYESKGWLVGKTKMKNWKAAASGWVNRMNNFKNSNNGKLGTSEARLQALNEF